MPRVSRGYQEANLKGVQNCQEPGCQVLEGVKTCVVGQESIKPQYPSQSCQEGVETSSCQEGVRTFRSSECHASVRLRLRVVMRVSTVVTGKPDSERVST